MAEIDFKEEEMSTLKDVINPEESELKNYVVDYVGNKLDPENENVAPLYHNEEILGLVIDKVNELTE